MSRWTDVITEDLSGLIPEDYKPSSLLDSFTQTAKEAGKAAVSAVMAAKSQLSYTGGVGNFQSSSEPIALTGKFFRISDTAPAKYGSPCYRNELINTMSGFIMCGSAVFVANTATAEEQAMVETYMNGGFFYE